MIRLAIVLSGALVLFSTVGAPLAEADEPTPKPLTVQGTVVAIDARTARLRMVSGTGHALRVITFVVEPRCSIRVAGVAAELGDLDRGRVVKIAYRVADREYLAESIEAMRMPAERGRP